MKDLAKMGFHFAKFSFEAFDNEQVELMLDS